MFFFRIAGEPRFYGAPTLWDFLLIAFALLGVLIFFRLIQYLMSGKPIVNALDFKDENRVVSPFLIDEQWEGKVVFSTKKASVFVRTVALLLLLLFLVIPLWEVFHGANLYNFYHFY